MSRVPPEGDSFAERPQACSEALRLQQTLCFKHGKQFAQLSDAIWHDGTLGQHSELLDQYNWAKHLIFSTEAIQGDRR